MILTDVPVVMASDGGGANGGGNQGTVFSIVNFCTSNSWIETEGQMLIWMFMHI